MAKEPLTYTRSLLDKLQKDLSRIAFVATSVAFGVSLLYYGYALAVQIRAARYVTMGVYVAIAVVSIAVFGLYLSAHNLKELEKRYSRERLRACFSWILIALRLIAVGLAFYQWFALSVSDFDKVVTVAMLVYLLLQALFEALKAFLFHYLDLFKLGFEEDKKTLGDDLKAVVADYVKEAISAKFKRGKDKGGNAPLASDPAQEAGPYERKLRAELEGAHDDFSAKRTLRRAEKARAQEAKPGRKKGKGKFASFFRLPVSKQENSQPEKEKDMAQGQENKVQ